jgi:hypothetical protein
MAFDSLFVAQGVDASGVPTMLLTVNSTVQIHFENRSKYIRARLDPFQVELLYQGLPIALEKVRV